MRTLDFKGFENEDQIIKLIGKDTKKIDFIFDEVTTHFNELSKKIEIMRNKATLLIGFLLTVIAFAIPEIVNNLSYTGIPEKISQVYIVTLLIIAFIYCLIACILAYTAFIAISLEVAGAEPEKIIVQNHLKNDLYIIKLEECEMYQKKIKRNACTLKSIANYFNWSLGITTALFFIGVMIISSTIICHTFF